MDIVKVTPDKEKAKSLFDTTSVRLDLIGLAEKHDKEKYSSKIVEEYYEAILEFITALMSLDGYKTRSDITGAHIATIEYLKNSYREFKDNEIQFIDSLRLKRNGIKYHGKHIDPEYVKMYESQIKHIVEKLKSILNKRLQSD